jgi:DNA-binding response OmpR family regulator
MWLTRVKEAKVKKILIVDDQLTVRRLLEIALEAQGIFVLQAASGEAAIELARAHVPDLVIMDVMMPGGMDGFETIRMLRADPQARACSILMLTARDQNNERLRACEAGADDYLAKPFRLADLLTRVHQLLGPIASGG